MLAIVGDVVVVASVPSAYELPATDPKKLPGMPLKLCTRLFDGEFDGEFNVLRCGGFSSPSYHEILLDSFYRVTRE